MEEVSTTNIEESGIVNENSRIVNENSRIVNENSRIVNENSRIVNENSRIVNENSRIVNENSRIRITSNCEDGAYISSQLCLKNTKELSIKFCTSEKNFFFARPTFDGWNLSEQGQGYYNGCDKCGFTRYRANMCVFQCVTCSHSIQLCYTCHDHHVHRDVMGMKRCYQNISENGGICIFCQKNPFIAIKRAIEELFKAKRSEIVLKHINVTVEAFSGVILDSHSNQVWFESVKLLSQLETRPIILMDNSLSHILRAPQLSYGFISKLFVLKPFRHTSTYDFERVFNFDSIRNSFIKSIGFVHSPTRIEYSLDEFDENQIDYPSDIVTVAKYIMEIPHDQLSTSNKAVNAKKIGSTYAYQLRYNRDLINNFNTVCTILTLARKYPQRCKCITSYQPTGLPIISNNPWGCINRDCFGLIMSYLHPRDWEIKDKKKRKGHITIKTPTYAKNIVARHERAILVFENQQLLENQLSNFDSERVSLEERISNYQRLLLELPQKQLQLKQQIVEAEQRSLKETECFWEYVQNEIDITKGTKKRQRTKKSVDKPADADKPDDNADKPDDDADKPDDDADKPDEPEDTGTIVKRERDTEDGKGSVGGEDGKGITKHVKNRRQSINNRC
jgi:hypothetical protein